MHSKILNTLAAILAPVVMISAVFLMPLAASAQSTVSTGINLSPVTSQIQALESQLEALKEQLFGGQTVATNPVTTVAGPQPLFPDPNSLTLNVAANSSSQALAQCQQYQAQNTQTQMDSINCVWNGTLIGTLQGTASAMTAPYQASVGSAQVDNFGAVTYANAWGNCQALIANNPTSSIRCVWNNQLLYAQNGTNQNTQPLAPTTPQGAVGQADCSAITGYAYDPLVSANSVNVVIYKDGPIGTGTYVTSVTANILRPDVNSEFGITGSHGFSIVTPSSLLDGRSHTLYVYAESASPATNASLTRLAGSPSTITCNVPQVNYSSQTTYPSYYYSPYGSLYAGYPTTASTQWTNGYNYNGAYQPLY